MKRAIFFVLLLQMEIAMFSQNLVINPGFETWDKIDSPFGWTIAKNCVQDPVNIKSGSYACQHTALTGITKNVGQAIAVVPGKSYSFSFFFKTEVIGTEHGCRIWCHWEDAGGSTITDPLTDDLLEPSLYMNSVTWQQFSLDIAAPPGAVVFSMEVRTYQNSKAYLDDFVFQEIVSTYKADEESSDILIYPNPASDYLIISYLYDLQHIDIQSITGISNWSSDFSGEKTVNIPVYGLADGLYIICIKTSHKFITRKFIKK